MYQKEYQNLNDVLTPAIARFKTLNKPYNITIFA
ncbi:MAG: hypothetical protein PWR04_329 [Anaerophaga sp.]|jgi:hypothetical protein|nr:hypothetical protein [Anaerophaga sp.]